MKQLRSYHIFLVSAKELRTESELTDMLLGPYTVNAEDADDAIEMTLADLLGTSTEEVSTYQAIVSYLGPAQG
jgi:hypothetical protein